MIKFEWVCRVCNEHYPCRKVFVGYNGVFPNEAMLKEAERGCISPFHCKGDLDRSHFELVRP